MQLRQYQIDSVNSIFNYFASGKSGNPVLALPTGTGKSIIIAEFCKTVFRYWPNQRILMLVHVKELVEQNANKLKQLWSEAPLGIYSAGLNSREVYFPIVFGGIASVNSNPEQFGHRDLVIVDEAHCISNSENTMYQKVIVKLKEINPNLKVIGLTATPYRLGQGMITDGGLFTDICFDLTGMSAFNELIAQGFLAPLIPKRTSIELDTSNVGISNGDFKQKELQDAVDIDEITYKAIKELIEYGQSRHCGMVFTTGIKHTENVCSAIQSFGETATFVHSKMPTKERDERLLDFKAGIYKWIVSNGVLTTGFDHPPVDIGGILRPTMSPGLWVQILGRYCRPYDFRINAIPGFDYVKENALILDFAGNTKRLGPINDPVKPRKKGQKTGEAPIRICPECGVYNHASARKCYACGHEFPEGHSKLFDHAGTEELIKSDLPLVESFKVDRVFYHKHQKPNSKPILRVSYYSGLRKFEEFVAIEHPGFAGRKAREWWMQRYPGPHVPETIDQAMTAISYLKIPKLIKVHTNKKHPEILSHEY